MAVRRIAILILAGLLASAAPLAGADDADDVKARIAAAGDADRHDADLVVVFDHTDVRVRRNGIGTARGHKVVKILREGGIRSQATQRFLFDPHTNRLELVAIRVYRADGEIEDVDLAEKVRQPQTASGLFWPTDQYLVSLPRLDIGDAVETIFEMTGFNVAYLADDSAGERNAYGAVLQPPVPGHWHDEVHFWSSYPVLEQRYTLKLPKDMPLQFEMYNGEVCPAVTFDETHMTYSFKVDDIEPVKGEPRMEPRPNRLPKLLLATLPTWQDKARWLYQVSEPMFGADPAITRKVHEIIDGLETDEQKYTALNHWVADNIRYAGTSRGMSEGYTIHDIKEVFHDRCGVCKDKAGMLVGMLRVAGYDSFLVMTMARQRVDPIPADQFNHAVTCIRWPDGSLKLLDPTWMVNTRDNWSTLEPLQHVVYGLPEGKELSQSAYFPPEDNEAVWTAESVIDAPGQLTGTLKFVVCGCPEGRIRRTLAGTHPDDRQDFFDRTFQRLSPSARPSRVTYTDPFDYSGPLAVDCEFAAGDYALGDGDRRFLALPMLQTVLGDRALYDIQMGYDAEERKFGIALLATRLARFEETIHLPDGWKAVDLPEAIDIDGPAAGLRFEIEYEPGELRYTCELVIKRWLIPPEEYDNFKEVIDKFDELTGRIITCELEGARARR